MRPIGQVLLENTVPLELFDGGIPFIIFGTMMGGVSAPALLTIIYPLNTVAERMRGRIFVRGQMTPPLSVAESRVP